MPIVSRGVLSSVDLGDAERGLDDRAFFGGAALEVLVRVVLVAQTAHESAAESRDLQGVEREVLLLGHADRHGLELAPEPHAAQLLAAVAQPADHPRLVAHADLAHVDARVEPAREVADQVAEVHALLGEK